jgi:DNA-binding NarL/FixJ family response regulator
VQPHRSRPLRITVLNDYPVVLAGVAAMLAPYRNRVEVVRVDREGGLPADVDLVLYDTFGMSEDRARDVVAQVAGHTARLVIFSWATDAELVRQSLDAGAAAFLSKALEPAELVAQLERIHGGVVLVPHRSGRVSVIQHSARPGAEHGLSARESEVVALISRGLSNREIADVTFLSINSVKTYIRTAYKKMGVSTRSHAVVWGLRHGFDPIPSTDRVG